MLYRICTEDINRRQLTNLINRHFDGYTLYTVEGRWKGKAEDALVIEIVGDLADRAPVHILAHEIKALNEQESVLIEEIESCNHFV
mgnify:FL=1